MPKAIATILKNIAETFTGRFPKNYKNTVAHWGNFETKELHQANSDGTQKLLHLDIDLGNNCMLDCPHCFRRDDRFDLDLKQNFLKEGEILDYLKEAKVLGLRSVKFLGRGEPFENRNFIGFLRQLKCLDIKASVFTKGHVIGSDNLAKKFNSHYGINNGKQLAAELKKLDTSILLGFNSFDYDMQKQFVDSGNLKLKNYPELRDRALSLLVEAGLNNYCEREATRLALVAAPIKPENIHEIFSIYKWGRRRNIYVVSCPSNLSGKGLDEAKRVRHFKDYIPQLIDLYSQIYIWNIRNGLQTLEQFLTEDVSLYPGCHPCNQVAAGMYLTLSGKIFRCPGRCDNISTFIDDIRKVNSIKEVWMQSENYKRAEGIGFNYHCPARDLPNENNLKTLPSNFYREIRKNVLAAFQG
ncbi:hypothetical protein CVU82_04170 [Candidatus Falkowbacteria bacterium HGW-Falkowbacteria-1]|uniref:Radical SAM core domain-containing protein n=1 Tax=Candidatus Falkowbacteria bacterium HGW-Falkowbacteria-1 TaxID=2013768 RepID=A0A2N2E928_9BACT|nr:MAG: hypothetical protein CVU82_04170 [Candidatus Falkowbacteria bacterium HGW-Falkowbacteria-1]